MKKIQIIKIKHKHFIPVLFDKTKNSEIFYAYHNPFLRETEYEIHTRLEYIDSSKDLNNFITVVWGEKGYRYLTLKKIKKMIIEQYPELLI